MNDSAYRLFLGAGLRDDISMNQDNRFVLENVLEQSRLKDYPDLKPDKFFEIFSSQQALKTRGFNLDADELESGIVGGEGDGGVDGFYVFVNRKFIRDDTDPLIFKGQQLNIELNIVQGKNKASFDEDVPTKLKDFTEHCLRLNADIEEARKLLYSDGLLTLVKKEV